MPSNRACRPTTRTRCWRKSRSTANCRRTGPSAWGCPGEQESILQEDVTRHYNLVGIPASLKYDSTTSLLDPTKGIRATLSADPDRIPRHAQRDVLHRAALRLDLSRPLRQRPQRPGVARAGRAGLGRGRVRPAARPALLCRRQRARCAATATRRWVRSSRMGSRPGAPPSRPEPWSCGSVFLATMASWGSWTWGRSAANGAPFTSDWHAGAGVGARYYTPIGPIRLDVAVPLNKLPGGDSFEIVHRHRTGVLTRRLLKWVAGDRPGPAGDPRAGGRCWSLVVANIDAGPPPDRAAKPPA